MCREYSDRMWRYYLYIYARQVEMLDADVGRLLDAVEACGRAENTMILFTSDHGDGRGRHMHVSKWYPYDEAVKVPMIVACPSRIAEGKQDTTHLVSGVDVVPTICDYAGIEPPEHTRGASLRPLLENKAVRWRELVVSEFMLRGRMLRTDRYKYVTYRGDPVEMLFDMKADPWETKNLYEEPRHAQVLAEHRRMLDEYEAQLRPVQPAPDAQKRRLRKKQGGRQMRQDTSRGP